MNRPAFDPMNLIGVEHERDLKRQWTIVDGALRQLLLLVILSAPVPDHFTPEPSLEIKVDSAFVVFEPVEVVERHLAFFNAWIGARKYTGDDDNRRALAAIEPWSAVTWTTHTFWPQLHSIMATLDPINSDAMHDIASIMRNFCAAFGSAFVDAYIRPTMDPCKPALSESNTEPPERIQNYFDINY